MKNLITFVIVVLLTGCTTTVHNDQRTCTQDCNISSSQPMYAPAPVVYGPVYRPYYRRRPVVIYHW